MGIRDSGMGGRSSYCSCRFPIPYSRTESRSSGFLFHRLGLLERLVDAADHVERLLRQVVAFAVHDHLEAADGFLERHVLARRSGEYLGDVERLAEEALALARAVHGLLVLLAEFVHAEDRDDVLEFL